MAETAPDQRLSDPDLWVLELRVVRMSLEADEVVSLDLVDPEGGVLPSWQPGAHIDLLLGDVVRQYSLCGSSHDLTRYRVAVLRENPSRGGSSYAHERIRLGELVEVGGPRNHFQLGDHAEYLFVAGGIGITPILPMITEVERRGRPWRLFYGGRSRSSMAFADDLARLGPTVTIVPQDEQGMLDLPAILGAPRGGLGIYACGPSGLLQALEEQTADWPKDVLHVERFQAQARPGTEFDRPFVAECVRSGVDVEVPEGLALIDALELHGIRLPSACRDGVCGSCETVVLAGDIEHRDCVLSAPERDRGDRMMVCVSRASTGRLVLDL